MRFVCDVSGSGTGHVLLALNPVTKTEVKISPPFEWVTLEELETFARNFELYCSVSWQFGKLDPSKVNPSAWPKRSVMDALFAGDDLAPRKERKERDELNEHDAVTD